jgi:hypothetical protein
MAEIQPTAFKFSNMSTSLERRIHTDYALPVHQKTLPLELI